MESVGEGGSESAGVGGSVGDSVGGSVGGSESETNAGLAGAGRTCTSASINKTNTRFI